MDLCERENDIRIKIGSQTINFFFCEIPISAPENQWISIIKINITK